MITATFLALSGAVAPPPQADIAGSVAWAFRAHEALVFEIDETHLSAQSRLDEPLLLIFSGDDPDLSTLFWLPAESRYDEHFQRGTLEGLRVDVLWLGAEGWTATGALDLPDGSASPSRLTVLTSGHALVDEGDGNGQRLAIAAGSLLPQAFQEVVSFPEDGRLLLAPAPRHVPVQTPTDKPRGDKPPKLEKKPLPPV